MLRFIGYSLLFLALSLPTFSHEKPVESLPVSDADIFLQYADVVLEDQSIAPNLLFDNRFRILREGDILYIARLTDTTSVSGENKIEILTFDLIDRSLTSQGYFFSKFITEFRVVQILKSDDNLVFISNESIVVFDLVLKVGKVAFITGTGNTIEDLVVVDGQVFFTLSSFSTFPYDSETPGQIFTFQLQQPGFINSAFRVFSTPRFSNVDELSVVQGNLVFIGEDSEFGKEVRYFNVAELLDFNTSWSVKTIDVRSGPESGIPDRRSFFSRTGSYAALLDEILIAGDAGAGDGVELHRFTLSDQNLETLVFIHPGEDAEIKNLQPVGDYLAFQATSAQGINPYVYVPAQNWVYNLAAFQNDQSIGEVDEFILAGGRIHFVADDPVTGFSTRHYSFDPLALTLELERQVFDSSTLASELCDDPTISSLQIPRLTLSYGTENALLSQVTGYCDDSFIRQRSAVYSYDVQTLNHTEVNLTLPGSSNIRAVTASGDYVFLIADSAGKGSLLVLDTATQMIRQPQNLSDIGAVTDIAVVNERLYFRAFSVAGNEARLYRYEPSSNTIQPAQLPDAFTDQGVCGVHDLQDYAIVNFCSDDMPVILKINADYAFEAVTAAITHEFLDTSTFNNMLYVFDQFEDKLFELNADTNEFRELRLRSQTGVILNEFVATADALFMSYSDDATSSQFNPLWRLDLESGNFTPYRALNIYNYFPQDLLTSQTHLYFIGHFESHTADLMAFNLQTETFERLYSLSTPSSKFYGRSTKRIDDQLYWLNVDEYTTDKVLYVYDLQTNAVRTISLDFVQDAPEFVNQLFAVDSKLYINTESSVNGMELGMLRTVNQPPKIEQLPDQIQLSVNEPFQISGIIRDDDSNPQVFMTSAEPLLRYELTSGNGTVSVDMTMPTIVNAPFDIRIEAMDVYGESATKTIEVVMDTVLPISFVEGERKVVSIAEDSDASQFSETLTLQYAENRAINWAIDAPASFGAASILPSDNNALISYLPEPDFNGTDEFTVQACDDLNNCATFVFVVEVEAVNDAPEILSSPLTFETEEDSMPTQPQFSLSGTDADGDQLSWEVISPPQHGQLSLIEEGSNVAFQYTPQADYSGADEFTVELCDDTDLCVDATVSVTVLPVNDAPQITQGEQVSIEMSENGSPTAFDLTLTGSDIDSHQLSWTTSVQAANGQVTLSATGNEVAVNYVPDTNFVGTDTFTIALSDGELTDEIVVDVSIERVSPPPPPVVEQPASGTSGGSLNAYVIIALVMFSIYRVRTGAWKS